MARKRLFWQTEQEEPRLDIGPLLDMVFILLIFFVVTTTFTRQTGVEVKKPKASSASRIKDKTVLIAITREGTVHIHEKQVDLPGLQNILKKEKLRRPNVRAVIIADRQSVSGRMVEVIDQCNLAGIGNVSIAAVKN